MKIYSDERVQVAVLPFSCNEDEHEASTRIIGSIEELLDADTVFAIIQMTNVRSLKSERIPFDDIK